MRLLAFLLFLLGFGLAQEHQIVLSPTVVEVEQGGSSSATLTIYPNGLTGALNISITGLPRGVSYTPKTVNVEDPEGSVSVQLVFTAEEDAETGWRIVQLSVEGKSLFFDFGVSEKPPPPPSNPSEPTRDYEISLSPVAIEVEQGGSATATLTVYPKGFTGNLSISIPGLPQGVSYTPNLVTVNDPDKPLSVELVFNAAENAETGWWTLTLKVGEKGILFDLGVERSRSSGGGSSGSARYEIALSTAVVEVEQGGQATAILTVYPNGFTGTLEISLSGLPEKVSYSPSTVQVDDPWQQKAVELTLKASQDAKVGWYYVVLKAGEKSVPFDLHVKAPSTPQLPQDPYGATDFHISLTPVPISLGPGGSAKTTLAVMPNGNAGELSITFEGLPQGVSYSPTSILATEANRNATVELVFAATDNVQPGTYDVTLKVAGYGIEKTFGFSLVVDAQASPSALDTLIGWFADLWNTVKGWLESGCSFATNFSIEPARWICTLYRLAEQAEGLWNEVQADFEAFKKDGFLTAASIALNYIGAELKAKDGTRPFLELNRWADDLERDFLSLRRNYRQMTAKISNWMAQARQNVVNYIRNNPFTKDTPSWWVIEAMKINPNLGVMKANTLREQEEILRRQAQAEATSAAAESLIEKSSQGGLQGLAKALQVTNPVTQSGEAEEIVNRAREANSTREVLEVLVDAQAKLMRQNLANTQEIVNAIREAAVQQAYTTQQLKNLIDLELKRRMEEVSAWEAEVEQVMARTIEEAEIYADNIRLLGTLSHAAACPDGTIYTNDRGETACLRQ